MNQNHLQQPNQSDSLGILRYGKIGVIFIKERLLVVRKSWRTYNVFISRKQAVVC